MAASLGLLQLVHGFCASGEIDIEKPDPRIFDEAIRSCASKPRLAKVRPLWMVGDTPIPDIRGDRSFGLRTIWIHRERAWDPSHGAVPDHSVASVPEAVTWILNNLLEEE